LDLLKAPEDIVQSRIITLDSLVWSVMPWMCAGFIGGLLSKGPQKGAVGSVIAAALALILFIIVVLVLESIALGDLLNIYGSTMVVGFIVAAILSGIGGALGGTLTQS
jgi:hypothetical protein